MLLLSFLLLLFGMNDDGEDDDEVEEVIMQRVEGAVVIEEVKLIFFLSFCDEFKFSPLFLFGAASKHEHFYSLNGSRRTVSKRADSWAFVFFFLLEEDDEEEKESQTKSVPRVKEECVLSSCASKL